MKYQHANLASGRWKKLTFAQQMANIGSEVGRAFTWKKKNEKYSLLAAVRALQLIDLTIKDNKNEPQLKELCRAREIIADFFWGENKYKTDKSLEKYFLSFNYYARINK